MAAVYHFRASLMAVIARTLTFDQRQTEDWPCWQIWPIVCVLQLCFLDEDLQNEYFRLQIGDYENEGNLPKWAFWDQITKILGRAFQLS